MQINCYAIDRVLSRWENRANKLDWIPYVHFFSGGIRVVAAAVQMVAGLALIALQVLEAILRESTYHFKQSWNGAAYLLHGALNFRRGMIALLPWGNVALLSYDALVGRFNYYPSENRANMEPGVYPLNRGYV